MSKYVIGDIHAEYYTFKRMLELISPSKEDEVILVGDLIDCGTRSVEMIAWLLAGSDGFTILKGDHEEEFVRMIQGLKKHSEKKSLDCSSLNDTKKVYEDVEKIMDANHAYWDYYGTIYECIFDFEMTLKSLIEIADKMSTFPYYVEREVNGITHIIAHAGYITGENYDHKKYKSKEMFNLYAGDDAFLKGGLDNGIVISGHNPTIKEGSFYYNDGKVFEYYDSKGKRLFYDIDCGMGHHTLNARLACIKLEDKEIFYAD